VRRCRVSRSERTIGPWYGPLREATVPSRPRRLTPRFSDAELADLAAAAAAVGMTPTGFCAEAALVAARGTPPDGAGRQDRQALAVLQRELFAAAAAVAAAAALHTAPTTDLPAATAAASRCLDALERLDELAARIDRTLR
jgi:hypothetical protein